MIYHDVRDIWKIGRAGGVLISTKQAWLGKVKFVISCQRAQTLARKACVDTYIQHRLWVLHGPVTCTGWPRKRDTDSLSLCTDGNLISRIRDLHVIVPGFAACSTVGVCVRVLPASCNVCTCVPIYLQCLFIYWPSLGMYPFSCVMIPHILLAGIGTCPRSLPSY